MKYNEQDMAALISEVEAQFAEHLAKAEAGNEESLQKSEEIEEIVEQAQEAVEASEQEEVQKSETSEEVEFDYDEEDIAEMDKMYASMSKSEAQAHFESIRRALGEDSSEEVVEKDEEVMAKSEETEKVSEGEELLKSELDSVKKENEELKKSFENLTQALTKFVKKGSSAPKQKAITRIEYIAKSEDEGQETADKKEVDVNSLSKTEVSKILSEKIKDGKLEKSDREKINQYYLEDGSIENIKHLLV